MLTFIFGEISGKLKGEDEFEEDEGGFLVPGYMRLMDFHDLTNIDIDDPVMTTIGGVVFRLFGRLPTVGDMVQYEGYDFRVLEMNRLRISRSRVSKSGQAEEEEAASAQASQVEVSAGPEAPAERREAAASGLDEGEVK